jgi:hypothetical protein
VLTGGNAVQAYVRPLPPPGPDSQLYTSPIETVRGFLAASATYAYDPEAARQFLSPALRKTWRPGPVTVVGSLSDQKTLPYHAGVGSSSPAQYTSVEFTVQHLATLNESGQYQYSGGTSTFTFLVEQKKNGVWLINDLPQGGRSLLLTQASFQEVYQPRNLFFFAREEPSVVNGELVPDPVYAPVQSADSALNTDVVAGLVKGLLKDQFSWLSDSTTTAFPSGTRLLKVTLRGQAAIIDLGGAAERASPQQKNDMYFQLLATLASKAYSSPLARSVAWQINGRTQYRPQNVNLIDPVSTGPLVYQSGSSAVGELNRRSGVVEPAQIGSAQITALAATTSSAGSVGATSGQGNGGQPVPAVAVAVPDGRGCAVEIPELPGAAQPGGPYKSHPVSTSGGPCTSLSWDRNGNLWAVAGGHVMRLSSQTGKFLAVSTPGLPPDGKSGVNILSLQMAPDGIRAALLVKTPHGRRVLLAAVIDNVTQHTVSLGTAVPVWTGLPGPTALSWYSPYDLVVLTSTGIWQVPLTGGAGRLLGTVPAGAESLASDGVTLVVGAEGAVYRSSNEANSWKKVALGALPAYSSLVLSAPISGPR